MLELVTFVPNLAIGLLCIRANCLTLDLRSNRIYAICHLVNVTANYLGAKFGLPPVIRALILNPSTTVIMPIAYSRGPLRTRIVRVLTLCLAIVPAEAGSAGVYMLLGHGPYFTAIDSSNYVDIALTYCVTIVLCAISFELLIYFYRRIDHKVDAQLETPVLTSMGACYTLILITFVRFASTGHRDAFTLIGIGTYALFGIVYALATLTIARRDVATQRILANEAASQRQERHVTRLIEASSRKRGELRRVRHDLANQIDVVSELAESGRDKEASRYMATLRERVRQLSEDET